MKSRTALILIVVAVVAIVGGWLLRRAIEQPATDHRCRRHAGLSRPRAEAAGKLHAWRCSTRARTLAMVKEGDHWGLPDKGGYPIQEDKLRALMTGLTELRITEPRTSDPDAVPAPRRGRSEGPRRDLEPVARARRRRQADRRADRRSSARPHTGQCPGVHLHPTPRRSSVVARGGPPPGRCRSAALDRARHRQHRPQPHRLGGGHARR